MRRPSIRRRLISGCVAVAAVVLGVSKVSIYLEVRDSLEKRLDEQLLVSANLLSKSAELEAGGIIYEWQEASKPGTGPGLGGLFEFWDLENGMKTRSPDLKERDLEFFHGDLNQPVFREINLPDGRRARAVGLLHHPFINAYGYEEMVRRGRVLKVEDHPQVVVYAQEMESMQGVLEETRYRLLRSGLLTLGAVALAIFWIIRRTLRPLERFTENLAGRSSEAGAALPDIPENLPEELFPLAVAFNSTLEKVEIARAHERDFTFSAAHQMRTPVAGIHAILELAHTKSGDSPDLHQRIGSALAITREMRAIINSLMKLVRIRGGIEKMEPVPFAPGPVVLEILEGERKRAGDRYVVASTGLDGGLSLKGDEGMFSILVSTLLENAFRYTPEGGSIRAAGQVEGDRWLLEIANSRGDFDEKDQERIFRPFQRGNKVSVNVPGAGLGLPLAREISIWLGGTLEIRLTGQEVVFCLSLPLE